MNGGENMNHPKRKPLRLQEYDYSTPGGYFVTICTENRRRILSEVVVGDGVLDVPLVRLSPYGKIVEETLHEIVEHYDWLTVDKYVIMPNHIHLLLGIQGSGTSRTPSPTSRNDNGMSRTPSAANDRLPKLISTFKRFSNRRSGCELWQRSYHEHVIRNERDYREIWAYIDENPARWTEDRYYIDGTPPLGRVLCFMLVSRQNFV